MKPTLLILAAGMGSRYGGLKQVDGFGPAGETIMEYSVFDAIRAGFGKVVFVVKPEMLESFRQRFGNRIGNLIETEYVTQALPKIPEGFNYDPQRTKPWGTAHAVLMAAETIKEPFAVINADDFYGADAFYKMAVFLTAQPVSAIGQYCMVGYLLKNVLSPFGPVSRGVCTADEKGYLHSINERTQIERKPSGNIVWTDDKGQAVPLAENTIVSMNMWGFTPDFFQYGQKFFEDFLKARGMELKSECYIPSAVQQAIREGAARVRVLETGASWFGVTYKEDKQLVVQSLNELVDQGVYSPDLWSG